jgi:hypothetical protein
MKWLAVAAVALAALLLLLWKQLDGDADIPAAAAAARPAPEAAPTTDPGTPAVQRVAAPAGEPAADEAPRKLDPEGDEFFHKFIEVVPAMVSREAATCYEGRQGSKHRNQRLVLEFKVRVRAGVVTMHDVRVKPDDPSEPDTKNNSLEDPGLESCFIQQVARTTWRDDSLPDYEWPDELVIRPERGLKKYSRANIDYVGDPAPN